MSKKETPHASEKKLPMILKGRDVALRHENLLKPKADLTYRLMEDVLLTGINLELSLLTGSNLRNCKLSNVILCRSDLDGIKVEGCAFNSCDFRDCDIRASVFLNSTFSNCKFDSSYISECIFDGCSISECSFSDSIQRGNRYTRASFKGSNLYRSSAMYCHYELTTFENERLGDCTFLYIIMINCTFSKTVLSAESIGTIYGLQIKDLVDIELLYLGDLQRPPNEVKIADALLDSYVDREWNLGVAVISMNFGLSSVVASILHYIERASGLFRATEHFKHEEAAFLLDIFELLESDDSLPLLAPIRLSQFLGDVRNTLTTRGHNHQITQFEKHVRPLLNRCDLLVLKQLDRIREYGISVQDNFADSAVIMEVDFLTKPSVDIISLLSDLTDSMDIAVTRKPERLASRDGSFIEIIAATLISAYAFQLFLFIINGCLIQVTELKARIQALMRKEAPASYLEKALTSNQSIPQSISLPLKTLVKHAQLLPWLDDSDLKGYSKDNIKKIKILPSE